MPLRNSYFGIDWRTIARSSKGDQELLMTWLFNIPSCRSRESNFCQYVREGKDYQDGCCCLRIITNVLLSLDAIVTFLAQKWREQ